MRTLAALVLCSGLLLAVGANAKPPAPPSDSPAPVAAAPVVGAAKVRKDATALLASKGVADAPITKLFLQATDDLPDGGKRSVWVDPDTKKVYSNSEAAALAEDARAKLKQRDFDEDFYYTTGYGSPLAYSRAVEVLATAGIGFDSFAGKHIMDFGYGGIGHLRLMASLGAEVVGVEVSPILRAYYSEPGDTGEIRRADPHWKEHPGHLTLVNGRWPGEPDIAKAVAAVGPFDLIISKNTLKKGYVRPDREADEKFLVKLGVPDADFIRALHDNLKPGGVVLIYNICPPLTPPDEPFQPHTDGRCPFTEAEWQAAGFEVIAFDKDDNGPMRDMAFILGWEENRAAVEHGYFASYTIVRRRK